MKYLKTFEGLTTSIVDKIKSDIKNMCVELTDIEFDVEITDNKEKLQWLYMKDNVGRYEIDITVTKSQLRDGTSYNKSYNFSDIYEYMEMVTDYLKEYPIEFSYMIDGINYNEVEYSHFIQRRIDKNHTFHKDVPKISIFRIKIKLEDETSK